MVTTTYTPWRRACLPIIWFDRRGMPQVFTVKLVRYVEVRR